MEDRRSCPYCGHVKPHPSRPIWSHRLSLRQSTTLLELLASPARDGYTLPLATKILPRAAALPRLPVQGASTSWLHAVGLIISIWHLFCRISDFFLFVVNFAFDFPRAMYEKRICFIWRRYASQGFFFTGSHCFSEQLALLQS